METANNTIKTRISHKSDTEANWVTAGLNGFIPLKGELIIYTNANKPSKVKIGDGNTNVNDLLFIDAGYLNGEEELVSKYETFNNFPEIGSSKKLYLDLSNSKLYHYDGVSGYKLISSLQTTSTEIKEILYWGAGRAGASKFENNVLIIENGVAPTLVPKNTAVLTNVQIGGNNA